MLTFTMTQMTQQTLWPQPWVGLFYHLGAIPRKPNDSNNCLSIMWWEPTHNDFKSFDGNLIGGIGELSGTKLLPLWKMMSSIEDRIEDHKKAFPDPNKFLLLLVRAMQDTFTRLDSLKPTITDMRIGISEFQCYYLEIYSCLDYLENFKLHMDGERPPAESIVNCMGTFTNIPQIVQDFYTAGLPVWFLQPSTTWDSSVRCKILETVIPLDPADILCVLKHYLPFPALFYGSVTDPKKHSTFYNHSQMWLVFKDPFGGLKGKLI